VGEEKRALVSEKVELPVSYHHHKYRAYIAMVNVKLVDEEAVVGKI